MIVPVIFAAAASAAAIATRKYRGSHSEQNDDTSSSERCDEDSLHDSDSQGQVEDEDFLHGSESEGQVKGEASVKPKNCEECFDTESSELAVNQARQSELLPSAATLGTSTGSCREPLKYVLRLSGVETLPKGYTVYYVRVALESHSSAFVNSNAKSRLWFIRKRYRDFDVMRQGIVKYEGHAPELPAKQFFGTRDPDFVRSRSQGLSTFLWQLAADARLCSLRCVHHFLWSDVCLPPITSMLPNTPLISRRPSFARLGQSFDMSDSLSTISRDTMAGPMQDDCIHQASSDIKEVQGRLVLTSSESLRESFAKEGFTFVEEDVSEASSNFAELNRRYFPGTGMLHTACGGFFPSIRSWYSGDNFIHNAYHEPRVLPQLRLSATDGLEEESNLMEGGLLIEDHGRFTAVNETDDGVKETPSRSNSIPKLRFVFILVGSRGDVQPYVALGIALKRRGHYVRIAAHECFRTFVTSEGLGFAPLAGDPHELLQIVTEHSMFSFQFAKDVVATQRMWIADLLDDAWDACTLPADRLRVGSESLYRSMRRVNTRDIGEGPGFAFSGRNSGFRADVIVANPPSFAGWHLSEALGVPLFMSFPMPWSRTTSFPSPFTNAGSSPGAQLNWMSYGAVDRLIWLGSGDIVNHWRVHTLRLQPIWTLSARGHRLLHDNRVPFIYPWSKHVLPAPQDWGPHIRVCGSWFLDDERAKRFEEEGVDIPEYRPSEEVQAFIDGGSSPIFIGFGSIVVADPEKLSKIIVDTVGILSSKHRFIVQAGWANLDISSIPDTARNRVLAVGSIPHRWLFGKCRCVVHHGGAGTTAEAMRAGKPSVIVPFFGDQFFWARRIPEIRVGTAVKELSVKNLCAAIEGALGTGCRIRAKVLGKIMRQEDGIENAISFIEERLSMIPKLHQMHPETEINRNLHVDGGDNYTGSAHWRNWPYVDVTDQLADRQMPALSSLSRRVKVVGNALSSVIKSASSNQDSSHLGVELKEGLSREANS